MNPVLFDPMDVCVEICLDDILIFSTIVEKYQKALDTMFARLAKH